METKRCYRCKEEKPLSEFGRDKHRKDGLNGCCKACKKLYNAEQKDYLKQYMKTYREHYTVPQITRERNREYSHNYRCEHPENMRKNQAQYRARQAGCSGVLTESEICACLDYFDYKCAYSGRDLPHDYHLDHVVPLSKGGENTIHNIVPCCPEINLNKHNHDFEEWYRGYATFDLARLLKIRSWIEREG